MPVKILQKEEGKFEFTMVSFFDDQDGKYISFSADGSFSWNDNDSEAMTFVLEQIKI